MTEVFTIDFRRPIAVFPLPDAVLLPHTLMPLHIFEPRYRKMVDRVLDDVGLLAMGLFEEEVSREAVLEGRPPLRPSVCVGLIRRYEKLPSGRYFLLLQGVCRARLLQEIANEPYRLFTLEPGDVTQPEEELVPYREQIETLVRDLLQNGLRPARRLRAQLEGERSAAALIDGVLSALLREPDQRYAMLAEADSLSRATWLIRHLESLRRKPTRSNEENSADRGPSPH